ncbi:MAG TPA: DUF1592 domain-containing protein [Planctomycetota bacterium]|nr:DUF1592 domain-containing protein [Planctomycetota bacterium]
MSCTCAAALAAIAISILAPQAFASDADFKKVGYPFIQKHCIECHGEKKQESDLTLQGFKDEAAILKGRKLWHRALKMIVNGEMPPEKQPRPTLDEIEAFKRSVGAIFEKADRNAKPDPGRIAMRRLNRAEYNNTVRDLLGIDYNAAEDFPNDETGHGFDNISDVQWLSSVLMERYMAAAESVAARAIVVDPAKPSVRWQGAKHMEPAGEGVPKDKFRPISGEKPNEPIFSGPLHTPHQVPADGEYILRARVFAKPEGDQPVQVALLACGKEIAKPATDAEAAKIFGAAAASLRPFQILKTFTIKGRDEKTAETIDVKIPPDTRLQRVAIALLKPDEGKPVPKLFVEYTNLEGPLDTRPAYQRKNLDCPPGKPKDIHTREILKTLASRAYRRPATTEEVERLAKVVEAAEARGEKWEAGMQQAVQAVLISPKFLFRPEFEGLSKDPRPIDDYEMASRMSYFLWSSMPDDELLALAGKNELTKNIDAQVRRMLKDPKADALVDNFAMQWLQLRRLSIIAPDPKLFPNFNLRLKNSMLKETELFIEHIIKEDRSILDFIDSDYTFLNEALANHYGIADTNGNRMGRKPLKPKGEPIKGHQFRKVSIQDGERGGLLTQASLLTVTSNPTRTSPVKRGKWVLEQLLGTPPPPPPPNVPELEEEKGKVAHGTLRQRLEQHRAKVECASCHARMDPIGFAFENFDAIGAYRWKDGKADIDPSGVLPNGRAFKGYADLKGILKERKEQFARCITEKMLTYALGRGLEPYDIRTVDRIVAALAQNEYKFSTLPIEIVKSEPFRLRRGKEEAK